MVKRFEADLVEAEKGGDDHRQNKDDRADRFLVSAADSLDSLIVQLNAFHLINLSEIFQ
jgi:hypothetical protein